MSAYENLHSASRLFAFCVLSTPTPDTLMKLDALIKAADLQNTLENH